MTRDEREFIKKRLLKRAREFRIELAAPCPDLTVLSICDARFREMFNVAALLGIDVDFIRDERHELIIKYHDVLLNSYVEV